MESKQPRIINAIIPLAASVVDLTLYTVEQGAEYELVEAREAHTVAGSDGGAVTADVVKCTGTQAPSAGATMLSSTFNLKSTANTPVGKTVGSGLVASQATRTVKGGERICLNVTGTTTAVEGLNLLLVLKRRLAGTNR